MLEKSSDHRIRAALTGRGWLLGVTNRAVKCAVISYVDGSFVAGKTVIHCRVAQSAGIELAIGNRKMKVSLVRGSVCASADVSRKHAAGAHFLQSYVDIIENGARRGKICSFFVKRAV